MRLEWWRIRNGIRNVIRLAPATWHADPWDWSGLVTVMEKIMEDMAVEQDRGHHLKSDRYARQLRMCASLCRRIREDNYFENAGYRHESWASKSDYEGRKIALHADKMADQDTRYLGLIIGKYLRHWWD